MKGATSPEARDPLARYPCVNRIKPEDLLPCACLDGVWTVTRPRLGLAVGYTNPILQQTLEMRPPSRLASI